MQNLFNLPVQDRTDLTLTRSSLSYLLDPSMSINHVLSNRVNLYYLPDCSNVGEFLHVGYVGNGPICFNMDIDLESGVVNGVGSYWLVDEAWEQSYKTKGGAPDSTTLSDSLLLYCVPGASFLINTYWWHDRNSLAWYWGLRLMCDDSFLAQTNESLFPPNVQHGLLPPFVLSNLTG